MMWFTNIHTSTLSLTYVISIVATSKVEGSEQHYATTGEGTR